jgi:hypothetical protein
MPILVMLLVPVEGADPSGYSPGAVAATVTIRRCVWSRLIPNTVTVPLYVLLDAVTQGAVHMTPSICALSDPCDAHDESDVGSVGLQDNIAVVATATKTGNERRSSTVTPMKSDNNEMGDAHVITVLGGSGRARTARPVR